MTTDRLVLLPAGQPERGLGSRLTWRAAVFARTLSSVWRRGAVCPLHDLLDACLLTADLGRLDGGTLEDIGLRRDARRPGRLG